MTTLYMLTEGQGVLGEFSVTNNEETCHAYRTPLFAALMEPIFNFQDPHLFEVEGHILRPDVVGATCKSLKIVKEIPLPSLTTGERMQIAALCGSLAEDIVEFISQQSKNLDLALNSLLTAWSQKYMWTAEETAAIESKIELQTTLCAQAGQEVAKTNILVKKITWTLGNVVNAVGLCLPAEVGRWTAKTILAVIELPVLIPEILDLLHNLVEKVKAPTKKVNRPSYPKLQAATVESVTPRSKRQRVPPVRPKGMATN